MVFADLALILFGSNGKLNWEIGLTLATGLAVCGGLIVGR